MKPNRRIHGKLLTEVQEIAGPTELWWRVAALLAKAGRLTGHATAQASIRDLHLRERRPTL
jgi:hypothetical protein